MFSNFLFTLNKYPYEIPNELGPTSFSHFFDLKINVFKYRSGGDFKRPLTLI